MNKDLAGVSAIWRTLFGVRVTAFIGCFHVVKEAAENGFAADFGFVSGDGHSFRCCTVDELLRDCDSVSVRAVQEKCDEKGGSRGSENPMRETAVESHPFGFAQGRLFSQSARKRMGTRPESRD